MAVTVTGPILSFSTLSCNIFNGRVLEKKYRDEK
jgi:hypothetical protein